MLIVTTHVVSLKLFRLSFDYAQDGERSRTKGLKGVRRAQLPHFDGETVTSRTKHGLKMRRIPVFPNSLQSTAYLPE